METYLCQAPQEVTSRRFQAGSSPVTRTARPGQSRNSSLSCLLRVRPPKMHGREDRIGHVFTISFLTPACFSQVRTDSPPNPSRIATRWRLPRRVFLRHNPSLVCKVRSLQHAQRASSSHHTSPLRASDQMQSEPGRSAASPQRPTYSNRPHLGESPPTRALDTPTRALLPLVAECRVQLALRTTELSAPSE